MNVHEIEKIRKIFIKKQDLSQFTSLHKKLFKQYWPNEEYHKNKFCNWWHSCVFMDYCGDLMADDVPFKEENKNVFFNDKPGPVG